MSSLLLVSHGVHIDVCHHVLILPSSFDDRKGSVGVAPTVHPIIAQNPVSWTVYGVVASQLGTVGDELVTQACAVINTVRIRILQATAHCTQERRGPVHSRLESAHPVTGLGLRAIHMWCGLKRRLVLSATAQPDILPPVSADGHNGAVGRRLCADFGSRTVSNSIVPQTDGTVLSVADFVRNDFGFRYSYMGVVTATLIAYSVGMWLATVAALR